MIVIDSTKAWHGWRVFAYAVLHAAGVTLGTWMTFLVAPPPSTVGPFQMPAEDAARQAMILAVLVATPVPWIYRRCGFARTLVYSLLLSVAVVALTQLVQNAAFAYGKRVPLLTPKGVSVGFWDPGEEFIATVVVGLLVTLLCRWRFGPLVRQDGTMCPRCGYSLIGSVDQTCSECGREFTFQELGTTREALYAKGLSGEGSMLRQGVPQPVARAVVMPQSASGDYRE